MSEVKYIEQLSVFIENRLGELCSITSLLEKEGISLLSIMLSDSSEFGILRLIAKESKRAKELLLANGFMAQSNNVIGVHIENRIGSFNKIVKIFNESNIDIRYTYTINEKNDGIFVFKIDENKLQQAAVLLEKHSIKTIGDKEL